MSGKQLHNKREFFMAVATPSLVFLSGFISYIKFHDYGLFEPEVLISIVVIIIAGSLLGLLLAFAGPTNLRSMGFAILLFVFLDIEFDLIEKAHFFLSGESGKLLHYGILIVILFASQLVLLGLRAHLATILATVFGTMLVTSILLPSESLEFGPKPVHAAQIPASTTPPVVYIILDGHIGIEGIPLDIDGGRHTKNKLLEFYERWGFRVNGSAYSNYILTFDSISNTLNGKQSKIASEMTSLVRGNGGIAWKPTENLVFKKYADSGYAIRVYQSDYLDYCQDYVDAIEYCYVYPSASPQLLRPADISASEKAELLLGSYFLEKSYYFIASQIYGHVTSVLPADAPVHWNRKNYQFTSLGAPDVINRLKSDILTKQESRLFFAHILLPHAPYVWDSECNVQEDSDKWLSRRRDHEDMLTLSNDEYRNEAYKYYFQQVDCTISLLDDLLMAMKSKGILDEATIVIHGDHGSRITIADPVAPMMEHLTSRDFIDSFSTLFAIKSPGIEPGYSNEQRAVQLLVADYVLGGTSEEEDSSVYLLTAPFVRQRPLEVVPVPEF